MTRAKRLDLVGAGAGVVLLSPLFLVVALPGHMEVPLSVARSRLRDFFIGYEQNPRIVVDALYPVVAAGGGAPAWPPRGGARYDIVPGGRPSGRPRLWPRSSR